MIRGEIWTLAGGPGYAGKPRPALIVQADWFSDTESVIMCGLTSRDNHAIRSRPAIEPEPANGLREASVVMIDKVTAVPRSKLGQRIGVLAPEDMERVGNALLLVFGIAG